ncbi:MAG: hypothetical protein WAW33_01255, partial [Minisyncoccia bacterium]
MKIWLKIIGFASIAILVIASAAIFLPTKNLLVLGSFLGNKVSSSLEIDQQIVSQPINLAILGFT